MQASVVAATRSRAPPPGDAWNRRGDGLAAPAAAAARPGLAAPARAAAAPGGAAALVAAAVVALVPAAVGRRLPSASLSALRRARRRRSRRSRGRVALAAAAEEFVKGKLTFQGDDVPRSLKSDGNVGMKDGKYFGTDMVLKEVPVLIGRGHDWSLDDHGFTLVDDPPADVDFYSERAVLKEYYPACCELVKKATGASSVYAFDHYMRVQEPTVKHKRASRGLNVASPVFSVHNDYSAASAVRQVRTLSRPPHMWDNPKPLLGFEPLITPDEADSFLAGRFLIVNVWRNIKPDPVQRQPFAVCKGRTMPLDDVITFRATDGRKLNEYYFAGQSDSQEWVYFPELRREEALLLKTWDSAGEAFASPSCDTTVPTTCTFHTAFETPDIPNGPEQRESIDVRTIAFF